jgi:hypothetical protein
MDLSRFYMFAYRNEKIRINEEERSVSEVKITFSYLFLIYSPNRLIRGVSLSEEIFSKLLNNI